MRKIDAGGAIHLLSIIRQSTYRPKPSEQDFINRIILPQVNNNQYIEAYDLRMLEHIYDKATDKLAISV